MDSVCIGLTSSNRVTFAKNSTGLGSTCGPALPGGKSAVDHSLHSLWIAIALDLHAA